jgi:hypothetical protein
MLGTLRLTVVFTLLACADEGTLTAGPLGTSDARAGDSDGSFFQRPDFATPGSDTGGGGAVDASPRPNPEAGAPTPDDGVGPIPDAGAEDPDVGAMGGPLVATIALTEIPQANNGSAVVDVTAPVEFNQEPGCVVVQVDPNAPPAPSPVDGDAGAITVTGLNGGMLVFNRGADGQYAPAFAVGADVFPDGAPLHAEGAGGADMGAFAIDVNAPQGVSVSGPGRGEQVDPGDGLRVRWNPAGGTTVLVTISPADSNFSPKRGNWVFCGAADTGEFTVPAEQMRQLPSGGFPLGEETLVVVTRTMVTTTQVGPHQAVFAATTAGGQGIFLQ